MTKDTWSYEQYKERHADFSKYLREKRGSLSLLDFSVMCEVAPTTIYNMEKDTNVVKEKTFNRICNYIDEMEANNND